MTLEELSLSRVLSFHNGKKPPELVDDGFPIFGSNGRIGTAKTYNFENAVILGRVGAYCGSVEFCEGKFWASDNTIVVKPLDGFDAKYLYFNLKNQPLRGYAGGAAQPLITHGILKPIRAKFHQHDEQKRIAAILSAYDDLIENNRRRIALLEEAARQLYKEWFVRFRFPGHEHVKIIDGVPEGWSQHKITDVWEIAYGKNLPTSNISEAGAFPVHGADGIIGYYSEKNIDQKLCLITCRGAGSGNVRRTFGPTFVTNNCLTLKPKMKANLLRFHFAIHAMTELRIQDLRTGAAQPQITIAGIGHVLTLVPSDAVLDSYNVEVDPTVDLADLVRVQNDRLAKARDLLLPKLMNGAITV